MKTIKMFTTAASEDRILHAGEVYTLPDKVADSLLAGRSVHGMTADGKPVVGGPCAEEVRGVKGRHPTRPDPDEHKMDVDDEDEDEDEHEDDE